MKKLQTMHLGAFLCLLVFAFSQNSYAQTTSAASGDWDQGSTWVGGVVPESGDVIIADGHTIVYNADHQNSDNAITISSLDIQGTGSLVFPFSDDGAYDADFTLNITGTTTIASTASITTDEGSPDGSLSGNSADRTHDLNLAGTLDNDGTFDLTGSTTSRIVQADLETNTFSLTGSGTFTFYLIDFDASIVTFDNVAVTIDNIVDLNDNATLIVDGGTLSVGPDVANAFEFEGNTTSLTIQGGANVDIGTSITSNGTSAMLIDGADATLTINNSGGDVNIGNTVSGEGRFRLNNSATNFTFNHQDGTTSIGDNFSYQASAVHNLNVTGGLLEVGVGSTNAGGATFDALDQLTVTGGEFRTGNGLTIAEDLTVNAAIITTNYNDNQGGNFTIPDGVILTLENGSTLNAEGGLDVEGTLVIQGDGLGGGTASTVNIRSQIGASEDITAAEWIIDGEIDLLDGSTINFAPNANGNITAVSIDVNDNGNGTDEIDVIDGTINIFGAFDGSNGTMSNDILRLEGGADIDFDEGTINVMAIMDDPADYAGGNLVELNNSGTFDPTFIIGDGAGTSATLNLAPLFGSEATPTELDFLNVEGGEALFQMESDAIVQIGGSSGNIGSVLITGDDDLDEDIHFQMNGGTLDIAGSLDINPGGGFSIAAGTVTIGTRDANGANEIQLGGNNPDGQTIFEITGAANVTVGDGGSFIDIGNNNNSPAFGSTTAYAEFEVSGGATLNINGGFRMRDYNARFIFGGSSTINFNPQSSVSLDAADDIFSLQTGIVLLSGSGNINLLNPHAESGTATAIEINELGSATGNTLTSSTSITQAIDFSEITFSFGDGSETASGSSDQFDVDLSNFNTGNHTFGNFVINNPSGINRDVVITNSGENFGFGDITITSGTFDIADNEIDDSDGSHTFTISSGGTLALDTDFPGINAGTTYNQFAAYSIDASSTVDYSGSSDVTNAQVPDGTSFGDLTVSQSGIKTLSGPAGVSGTLTLSDGTLAAGTNLTMGASSTLVRTNSDVAGIITGTLQGSSNSYTISYTGASKTTQDGEWSGAGDAKNLTIDLNLNETLTLHNELSSGGLGAITNLTVTEGTLTDANAAFIHDVLGDIVMNTSYTGLGAINMTGSSSQRSITTSETATFSNLILNDANGVLAEIALEVTGIYTMTNGVLDINSGTMTIGSGGSINGTGSSSNYIEFSGTSGAGGLIQTYAALGSKDYPVGSNDKYTPATVNVTSASSLGTLGVTPVDEGSPFSLNSSQVLDLSYYWNLTDDDGFSDLSATLAFVYDDADINGNETAYIAARYQPPATDWTQLDATAVDESINTITFSAVDYIEQQFTAGEVDEFTGTITTYYTISGVTPPLSWTNPAHWTNTEGGTTAINLVPGTNSPVVIDQEIVVDADNQTAASVEIRSSGIMEIGDNTSGHAFTSFSGEGTLRIVSDDTDTPTFPNEDGASLSSFVSSSGGTIEYSGDGNYTIPAGLSSYNNLAITSSAGSTTKTLPDLNLTIAGNLSLTGGNSNTVVFSDQTNGDLSISGNISISSTNTLQFPETGTREITVSGSIDNDGTFDVANTGSTTHEIQIDQGIDNEGIFDMNTGGSVVDITFSGTGNHAVFGSGATTDFNRIIVNKGSDVSNELDITATNFTITDTGSGSEPSVDLENGTLKISTNTTITASTNGDFDIASGSALHLNNASAVVQLSGAGAGDLTLAGSIIIDDGTLTVGDQTDNTTDNNITYSSSSASITVNGGILNVGRAIVPDLDDGTVPLDYTQTGGIVSLSRNTTTNDFRANSTARRALADLSISSSESSFSMSGGRLEMIRADNGDGKILSIHTDVSTISVTGGTIAALVTAHDGFSSQDNTSTNDIALYSSASLWNLEIGDDGTYLGDFGNSNTGQDLIVQNDFTLNIGGTFRQYRVTDTDGTNNESDLYVGGNYTLTSGTWDVNDDGALVTFNGSGLSGQSNPQNINANGQTLDAVTLDNTNGSGSLVLTGDVNVTGNWTHTSGTFSPGTSTVTFNGTVAQTITSDGSTEFENLTLNNTSGVTLSGGDLTIDDGGVLTLAASVLFDIGDNGIIVENAASGAISVASPSATNMILVGNTTSANGLTLSFSGTNSGDSYTYPIGSTVSAVNYYTPITAEITDDQGTGTINVVPIGSKHPQTTATTGLAYYWQLSASGFSATPATSSFTFVYDDALGESGNDTGFDDAGYYDRDGFTWTNGESINTTSNLLTMTNMSDLNSDVSAGVTGVFSSPTVYYTLQSGDWDDITSGTTPWTNDVCGGSQTEVLSAPNSTNPVVVCSSHTLTIPSDIASFDASGVTIEGTLTSQVEDISGLNEIGGEAILEFDVSSTTTPTVSSFSSDFLNNGTVAYRGAGSYTLPTQSEYNNLIIGGSGTKSLTDAYDDPVNDANIGGDLTIENGVTFDMMRSTLTSTSSGTFTAEASSTSIVRGTNNFPLDFGTYSLDATSNTEYRARNDVDPIAIRSLTYGNLSTNRDGNNNLEFDLEGDIIVENLTISNRTILNSNNHSITLNGDWSRTATTNTSSDSFNEGTGTVILNGGTQSITLTDGGLVETFYNLQINDGVSLSNNTGIDQIDIENDLTMTGSATYNLNSDLLSLGGNLTLDGTSTLSNDGGVTFDNTSNAQSISGSTTTELALNTFTIQKASGVDLTVSMPINISTELAMSNEGNLILSGDGNDLTINQGATLTGNSGGSAVTDFGVTRMIRSEGGNSSSVLVKEANIADDWDFVFPIGVDDSGDKFTPVTVNATDGGANVGTGSTLSIQSINGNSPDNSVFSTDNTLGRHFDFDLSGLTGDVDFDIIFNYDDGDVVGDEGEYFTAYHTGTGNWNRPDPTDETNTDNINNQFGASTTLSSTGSVTLGTSSLNTEWIAGDNAAFFPTLYSRAVGVDCGSITCDWSDPTHWTTTDGGGTAASAAPTADQDVVISSGHTMQMTVNNNEAASISVIGTLDVAATTGNSLGDITGTGTISLESGTFPTFNAGGTTFFTTSGGEVLYSGDATYTLPTSITEYNNLSISGTTKDSHDKDLGVGVTVLGDLNITNVDLENSSDLDLELRGSFSATGGGTFELGDGTFTFANSIAAALSSSIIFGTGSSLTIDGIGEKQVTGNLDLNNLTINSNSGDLNMQTGSINIAGNWDNRAASNKLSNATAITFDGGGAQQLDGVNTFPTFDVSNSGTLTVNSGTQTVSGVLTLAASTTLDLGANILRIGNTLDVDAGTFSGSSGTLVYTSATDPEVQIDAITVGTLEIDKGASTNTLDNDPATITFTNLVITEGEYLGPTLDFPGGLTIAADGVIDFNSNTTMDIDGDFNNAAVLDLDGSGITQLNISGDYTNTGTLTPPATVIFDGAGSQALNNALSVTNFTKDGGGDLTLGDDLTISGALTLTSGDIISTTTNIVALTETAGNPIGSDGSHIVGAMSHEIASSVLTTKVFPFGSGAGYRPLELDLTQTSGGTQTYTAQIIDGAPTARTLPSGIDHVGSIRHYNIVQSPGETLVSGVMRITYGVDDLVTDTDNLRIVKDDGGSNWLNLMGNVTGTTSAGTIESTVNFTSFSDSGLASSEPDDSLPVELIGFNADKGESEITLRWSTAIEINNDHFIVEKSFDGKSFFELGKIDGNGNTNETIQYSFIDKDPFDGLNFYRLKQVDYDGQSEYFEAIAVSFSYINRSLSINAYPNPTVQSEINFKISTDNLLNNLEITITDLSGKQVFSSVYTPTEFMEEINIQFNNKVNAGLYHVTVQQKNQTEQLTLAIRK